jgi:hypothetical protein
MIQSYRCFFSTVQLHIHTNQRSVMKAQDICPTHRFPAGTLAALFAMAVLPAVAAPPANDNFANAITISGLSGTTTGTNVEATYEAEEAGTATVWWAWTAPTSAIVAFDTFGSDFDTTLSVYTGTSLATLEEVANNDDSGSPQSRAIFFAASGVTYYIAVDGDSVYDFDLDEYITDTGAVTLSWTESPGEIAIFKKTETITNLEHSVEERTSPIPASYTSKSTITSYVIYDFKNGRSAEIEYWSYRSGPVTLKRYSIDEDSDLPFDIIPGRLVGTKFWLDASSYHSAFSDPADIGYLGYGSLWGSSDATRGLATPLILSPTQTIIVPRSLSSFSLSTEHILDPNQDEEYDDVLEEWVPVGDPYFIRALTRRAEASQFTLDIPLTKSANLTDNAYPKASLENGIGRVESLLQSRGYQSDSDGSDSDSF